jgi:hypothetical protein
MPDRPRNRLRRRPASSLLAVTLAGVAVLGACSSSSSGTEDQDAAQAAGTIAQVFALDEDGEACLEDELESRPEAWSLLTGEDEPSAATQDALALVLESCVTEEQFATAVAGGISASLPPRGTDDPSAQTECLHEQILALGDDQRRVLMVGLLALAAPPTGELAIARNDVINGLYGACGVEIAD